MSQGTGTLSTKKKKHHLTKSMPTRSSGPSNESTHEDLSFLSELSQSERKVLENVLKVLQVAVSASAGASGGEANVAVVSTEDGEKPIKTEEVSGMEVPVFPKFLV